MASATTGPVSPSSVSVLVPVGGWAPYLAEALDGILDQVPAPGQVVVIDDACADPLRLTPDHQQRCELIRREVAGGPGGARASGLAVAHGEVIAFCDADDAWTPGSLALRLAALNDHPKAVVCFGGVEVVGPDGLPTGERWAPVRPGVQAGDSFAASLFEANPILLSSALVRRAALEEVGGPDSGLRRAEDWDMWLRLARTGAGFVAEPRAQVRYRRHPGGLTSAIGDLAADQLDLHARHAGLVDRETACRVRRADLTAMAHGLVREGRYREARRRLGEASALGAPGGRDRMLALALALPGVRRTLGRRSPY